MEQNTTDQFAAIHRSFLESYFNTASQSFSHAEQWLNLGMDTVKNFSENQYSIIQRCLSASSPQELVAIQSHFFPTLSNTMTEYFRKAYELAAANHDHWKQFGEAQYQENNQRAKAVVENISRHAPIGTETAVAAAKSILSNANAAFETMQKAAKQAVDITDSNIKAAAAAANQNSHQNNSRNQNSAGRPA